MAVFTPAKWLYRYTLAEPFMNCIASKHIDHWIVAVSAATAVRGSPCASCPESAIASSVSSSVPRTVAPLQRRGWAPHPRQTG